MGPVKRTRYIVAQSAGRFMPDLFRADKAVAPEELERVAAPLGFHGFAF
jgi:hypothetical protein